MASNKQQQEHLPQNAADKFTFLQRFEFEPKIAGVCHDYVNLHDGNNTSSGILNSEPLCGHASINSVYVSSGQRLTIHFVTDASAVYLGFNIIFTKSSTIHFAAEYINSFTCRSSDQVPVTTLSIFATTPSAFRPVSSATATTSVVMAVTNKLAQNDKAIR
ncbi:hypothetical protein C0Q70_06392 [Pomacea canaliculata]|uniref:CUB domain-containing protein n=1 Tax=Pomacea canaliculata TaxID=400727 RepID=A0A2T7PNW5_POMCA|nr:hypothetical protein C0Q70_06392 [Pomacea canaliculata]